MSFEEFGMLEMNDFGTFRSPSDQDERDSLRMLKSPPKKTYDTSMVLSRNEINITALRRCVTGEM